VTSRRTFLAAFAGGIVVAPLAGEAQPTRKIPVVGVLNSGAGPRSTSVDTARQGLRDLGYIESQTVAFDVRFAAMKLETLPSLAADLVRRNVDVILASGPASIRAVSDATRTIPIVALDFESDPVEAGFARSFAQPGGNITGCFLDQPGLTGKWLDLIVEAVPGTRPVAALVDMTTGPWQLAALKANAAKLGIKVHVLEIRNAGEVDSALTASVKSGVRALVQLSSPLFDTPLAKRIADFTLKHHLTAISMFRRFADGGGLMSYGPNQVEYSKRLSVYIDKILRGVKPADLPIEQPTKFELVINLKTAKALGLTIPQTLLLRADQVIE
jgi:putative tryptophan/tyrosine transport system substrate-binding protein